MPAEGSRAALIAAAAVEVEDAIGRAFLAGAMAAYVPPWRRGELAEPCRCGHGTKQHECRPGMSRCEWCGCPDVDEHQDQGAELGAAAAADYGPELLAELARIRAQGALIRWALNDRRRDELVRAAAAAGVSTTQIHRLTGIARTTVDRIVGH